MGKIMELCYHHQLIMIMLQPVSLYIAFSGQFTNCHDVQCMLAKINRAYERDRNSQTCQMSYIRMRVFVWGDMIGRFGCEECENYIIGW